MTLLEPSQLSLQGLCPISLVTSSGVHVGVRLSFVSAWSRLSLSPVASSATLKEDPLTFSQHSRDNLGPQARYIFHLRLIFFCHHRVQDEVRLHNQRACASLAMIQGRALSVIRSETHRPTSTPVLSATVGSNASFDAAGHNAMAAQNFSLGCTVVAPRSAKEAAPC